MNTDHLTYQWLTPILLVIIGFMIKGYLSSIDESVKQVKKDLMDHIDKVEEFIKETSEKYYNLDKKVDRLEDHVFQK